MKDIFRFRLLTQDRLSNSKTLFYPIKLIRDLFTTHDQLARPGLIDSKPTAKKHLCEIMRKCIDNINVITDKGLFKFEDIKTLEIDLSSKNVTVLLKDNEKAALLTKTDKGDTEAMRASILNDISIDHVIPMAYILEDKAGELPVLGKLTRLMKHVAKEKNMNITAKKMSTLNNQIIKRISFPKLIPLLPELIKEIEIINAATELQLMDKIYNIRKK